MRTIKIRTNHKEAVLALNTNEIAFILSSIEDSVRSEGLSSEQERFAIKIHVELSNAILSMNS